MEENKITLTLGDWLYNAGIVGLINILEHTKKKSVAFNERAVSFSIEELGEFEEKYFNYFIDTYEQTLTWSKIVSYKIQISYFEREDYKNFTQESLDALNKYIEDLKRYLKSNSHVAAYNLINNHYPILDTEKKIKKISFNKNEKLEDKIDEVRENTKLINEVIAYYLLPEAKKYIAAKNVMYTVIKNAWTGVSMLNPQTKRKDMYQDYREYFLLEATKYYMINKSKFKFNCFTCDRPIENLDTEMGFLNTRGFDTSRKTSHVWNYNNDVGICPICRLVYSCVPAGFTYVYSQGIFINNNSSLQKIVELSKRIKSDVFKSNNFNSNTTYKSIITAIQERENDSLTYELTDIQVVWYEKESYRFNILSKQMLTVIKQSRNELDRIIKASYKEIDTYFRLYEETVRRLFNNENLFLLIHKLLIYKLSKPEYVFYTMGNVNDLIRINFNYLKGVGYMVEKEKDILKGYSVAGNLLHESYKNRNCENKLAGIAYRLLNALKTNNQGMFMDLILSCYLYVKQKVPSFFIDCLKEKEQFKTIGYAFVSGLIDGKELKKDKVSKGE